MNKKVIVTYKFTAYSARRDLIPFALLRFYRVEGKFPSLTIQIYFGWWRWTGTLDMIIRDLELGIN